VLYFLFGLWPAGYACCCSLVHFLCLSLLRCYGVRRGEVGKGERLLGAECFWSLSPAGLEYRAEA
jgi:hypothetical protein